jgi:hypothetical protein
MNLNTINEVKRPTSADQITQWRDGYTWLAGIAPPRAVSVNEATSEFLLIDWRHFSSRAIHQVEIPWAIDRDKDQIFFIRRGPRLVKS